MREGGGGKGVLWVELGPLSRHRAAGEAAAARQPVGYKSEEGKGRERTVSATFAFLKSTYTFPFGARVISLISPNACAHNTQHTTARFTRNSPFIVTNPQCASPH